MNQFEKCYTKHSNHYGKQKLQLQIRKVNSVIKIPDTRLRMLQFTVINRITCNVFKSRKRGETQTRLTDLYPKVLLIIKVFIVYKSYDFEILNFRTIL